MNDYILYDYSDRGPNPRPIENDHSKEYLAKAIVMKFEKQKSSNSMIVLDRDGTLVVDSGYMSGKDQLKLNPAAVKFLRKLVNQNVHIAIATNQSGIGRGLFTLQDCLEYNLRMREFIKDFFSLEIDLIAICPHSPASECYCRKPSPTLLKICMELRSIKKHNTIFVGNSESDFESGSRCEVRTYDVNNFAHLRLIEEWIENQNDNH